MMINIYHDEVGMTCERCGKGIKNICVLTFPDGFVLKCGTECMDKALQETNISPYGTKFLKAQIKRIKGFEKMAKNLMRWQSVEDAKKDGKHFQVEDKKTGLWRYMTAEEFAKEKAFYLDNLIPSRIKDIEEETAQKLAGVRVKKSAYEEYKDMKCKKEA